MEKILWIPTGSDKNDILALVEEGMLRVERMNKKVYWWCVHFNDEDYHCWDEGTPGKTLQEAMRMCECKYEELKKENGKQI